MKTYIKKHGVTIVLLLGIALLCGVSSEDHIGDTLNIKGSIYVYTPRGKYERVENDEVLEKSILTYKANGVYGK